MPVHDEQKAENKPPICPACGWDLEPPCRCDTDFEQEVDDYLMGLAHERGEV